jgi:ADP-heptose:LPS heptosyltransferase
MADPPLLLVLRALGIGDLLTAVPALRALAGAFPAHRRVLITAPALAPLALLSGAVGAVWSVERLLVEPRVTPAPDLAVNLHSNSPQSYAVLLATGPRRLLGFAHPAVAASRGFPAVVPDEQEVLRWCRLLAEQGIPADPTRLDLPLPGPAPAEAIGATILHPGATHPARRWPAEHWAVVAAAERASGRQVIITGSAVDVPLATAVAREAGLEAAAVWAGRTDLLGLARLVAAAARTVSGDTGLAHLATALRTPSVVLFGAQHPPSRWGPPPDRPWHRVIWSAELPRPERGMEAIEPAMVLAALRALPPAPPPSVGPRSA